MSTVTIPPFHLAALASIKLDKSNYRIWLVQFVPILKGNELMGFVDGTTPCPPQHVADSSGKTSSAVNSAYTTWQQQDQLILSWINATLTPSVLSTIARYTSVRDVCLALEKRYAASSQARILQLKELQMTKRGDLSITEYVDKMTTIVDTLALAGKPVDDDDFITLIMNGVGPLYETTINSVQARETTITIDDLVGLLLTAELRHVDDHVPNLDHHSAAFYSNKPGFFLNKGRSPNTRSKSSSFGTDPSSAISPHKSAWTLPIKVVTHLNN